MASPPGGSPIDAGLLAMVASGALTAIRGVTGQEWFGPGQPLQPVAPTGMPLRLFDYAFSFNTQTQTRRLESGTTYEQLQALANGYDLLRLVIETRKDQVVKIPWTIRVKPVEGEKASDRKKRQASDDRLRKIHALFRYPDGEHDWGTWVKAALEEVFVTDTLSIAPQRTKGGDILGFDVIDGTTINRLIDAQGRTPRPPSPAYQQRLKGLPAVDLTTDQILYKPRNYRASRVYGFSPVEQIIVTVNLAMRRQLSQLNYYTDGNVPEAIIQAPETWTADEISKFQAMFDTRAGDQAKRSRVTFIPETKGITLTKEKMLMDQMDEWLARVVCFCLSVSPQPFIKMMNRATSQTANETALSEGLFPILDYISGTINRLIERYIGYDDLEFAFLDGQESDPKKQAEIDKIYASMGKTSIDELRERDGDDPIGMSNAVITATGPVLLAPFLNAKAGQQEAQENADELETAKAQNGDLAKVSKKKGY